MAEAKKGRLPYPWRRIYELWDRAPPELRARIAKILSGMTKWELLAYFEKHPWAKRVWTEKLAREAPTVEEAYEETMREMFFRRASGRGMLVTEGDFARFWEEKGRSLAERRATSEEIAEEIDAWLDELARRAKPKKRAELVTPEKFERLWPRLEREAKRYLEGLLVEEGIPWRRRYRRLAEAMLVDLRRDLEGRLPMPRDELEREVRLYVEMFILPKVREIEERIRPPERPAAFVPLTARPSPTLAQLLDDVGRIWGHEYTVKWFKENIRALVRTYGKESVFKAGVELLGIPPDELERLLEGV